MKGDPMPDLTIRAPGATLSLRPLFVPPTCIVVTGNRDMTGDEIWEAMWYGDTTSSRWRFGPYPAAAAMEVVDVE